MRKTLICTVALFSIVLFSGCGASRSKVEGVWKNIHQKLQDIAQTIEGVNDKQTLEAAMPKLEGLKTEVDKLIEEGSKMKTRKSVAKAVGAEYTGKIQAVAQRIQTAMFAVQRKNIEGGQQLTSWVETLRFPTPAQ